MIQIKWQTKQGKKIISNNIPENMVEIINQIKREIAKDVSTMQQVTIIWQLDNKRRGMKGKAVYTYNLLTKKVTKLTVYIFDNLITDNHDMRCVLAHEFGHVKDYLSGNFNQTFVSSEISADKFGEKIIGENFTKSNLSFYKNRVSSSAKKIMKAQKGKY